MVEYTRQHSPMGADEQHIAFDHLSDQLPFWPHLFLQTSTDLLLITQSPSHVSPFSHHPVHNYQSSCSDCWVRYTFFLEFPCLSPTRLWWPKKQSSSSLNGMASQQPTRARQRHDKYNQSLIHQVHILSLLSLWWESCEPRWLHAFPDMHSSIGPIQFQPFMIGTYLSSLHSPHPFGSVMIHIIISSSSIWATNQQRDKPCW